MTEPTPSLPPMDPTSGVIFCTSCSEYYALAHQPLCPICLDEIVQETRNA